MLIRQRAFLLPAPFVTSPFSAWLLPVYTSNVFMNAFFAVLDGSVAYMVTTFSTILYDAVRLIEEKWESWIEAIESGELPDVAGLGDYRVHLQAHLQPNLARATELRSIKKGEQGWLKRVWPNLAMIRVTLSGPYSMPLPKLRHHFGPSVSLQSVMYASTETVVGHGYDANDTNLYRLDSAEHIELLDIEKDCAVENLCQPWEVVNGKKYEVVTTNNDGLWRYLLNDVVEIAGFSPLDGQPLIRYVGRQDVAFRVHSEFVSQSFLQEAITSLSGTLGYVSEFTVELDERKHLRAYGFIVELQDELGPSASFALEQLKQTMLRNAGYKKFFDIGFIGNPTIRIVSRGTFNAYRNWYVDKTGFNPAQVKVPCAIVDPEVRQWLADRVIIDLELEYGIA
ncbi:hypothetical protein HYPSUDRAFT_148846 [Hypholoma sublateritium FD-334 SS-4]|uniref:Uncharacterized protein n=1 Tax=Hypholoma sublateritium (strain FD-334 SS-4) TaxID=945553 RepID=A0A0D2NG62_HYPSF|nr:hypothetical protein HYPSUDRAFT_148846 [Hypholoma sublateritium FD-334 SS-4]